jgi:CBS domain containing-hemolysin-like protein
VASFVRLLIVVLYPVVWVSEGLTKLISGGKSLHVFSREEFLAMARVGHETGQIKAKESHIIENLFRFESLRVTDIMTPRTVVMALPEDMTISEALGPITHTPFSRIPIYGTNVDDIRGFVLRDDVLINRAHREGDEQLKSLKRPILAVSETISLSSLLERFLAERQQIARVIDEYGGTQGIVTLEDLVETLMGLEIVDETDNIADMREKARKQWEHRAEALGVDVDLVEQS